MVIFQKRPAMLAAHRFTSHLFES